MPLTKIDGVSLNEFARRLGRITRRWGLGESVGYLWGTLLVSGEPLTQQELIEASGYSAALVSSSLSRLEELGFITTAGRRGRKKLYVAAMSFLDALESFLKKFVDMEITPAVELLSQKIGEIKGARQRSNAEKIIEEYRKGRAFIYALTGLMRKHKGLELKELEKALLG